MAMEMMGSYLGGSDMGMFLEEMGMFLEWLECYLEGCWKDGVYVIEKGRGEGRGRCREWRGGI